MRIDGVSLIIVVIVIIVIVNIIAMTMILRFGQPLRYLLSRAHPSLGPLTPPPALPTMAAPPRIHCLRGLEGYRFFVAGRGSVSRERSFDPGGPGPSLGLIWLLRCHRHALVRLLRYHRHALIRLLRYHRHALVWLLRCHRHGLHRIRASGVRSICGIWIV